MCPLSISSKLTSLVAKASDFSVSTKPPRTKNTRCLWAVRGCRRGREGKNSAVVPMRGAVLPAPLIGTCEIHMVRRYVKNNEHTKAPFCLLGLLLYFSFSVVTQRANQLKVSAYQRVSGATSICTNSRMTMDPCMPAGSAPTESTE